MQYDVKTPAEYINSLEDDWRREKLERLRARIKSKAPEAVEGINYKMLSYSDGKGGSSTSYFRWVTRYR